MIKDAKKDAGLILALKFGKKDKGEKEEVGEKGEDLKVAAEDILSAIEEKDAEALVSALCAFLDLHASKSDEDEDEKDEESDY